MPNTKPSAFTSDSTPDDLDMVPYIDIDGGGAGVNLNRKLSFTDLMLYLESRARVHNASTATQSLTAATDTIITGSTIAIPNGRLQAKSKYKVEMIITKAAVGTGTPTLNVRFGTAGTTADTSRLSFTWPAANTAVADEMKLTFHVKFNSVGSGTSAVLEGAVTAEHRLTTTGFGGTGQGANIFINTTGAGFDSTVANSILSISINSSTGGTWLIRQCWAMLENLA